MFKGIHIIKNEKIKEVSGAVCQMVKKKIRSIRLQTFVMILLVVLIPLIFLHTIIKYYYLEAQVHTQMADMQTQSAVIASEFSAYTTLSEAQRAGVYTQMSRYSTLNSVRIRIIDSNFVIASDSYTIENGKNIINSRVITAATSGKSQSGYDRKTGTIEAVVPIYGDEGQRMGVLAMDMDISELREFSKQVDDKVSTVMVAVIVIATAFVFLMTKFLGEGFKKAFKVVEEIASGHTDKRLKVKGCIELREFAQDFNTIMDKASVLDESRQEFVSNVSHELKTPITSIKVLADSLNMQEDVPVELYKEFMQDITNEIDRESKIIEDLLSLVKMDKPAEVMNIASVNLNELLEIVLKRLKPIAQKKNVEILLESFRPVVAEIDEVKFTQVVSNLVENAIKYNQLDGWVHVSLNADYQYFYVRVEDSGIGIPKECQDLVFERFYRVDKARSRETGGTGLGLAIVQKIILMHHGTIKLHSEEGVGTTFTVRIPLNYVA